VLITKKKIGMTRNHIKLYSNSLIVTNSQLLYQWNMMWFYQIGNNLIALKSMSGEEFFYLALLTLIYRQGAECALL
jgi:hypothetical protein